MAVFRLVELDLVEVELVAREVHDPRDDGREALEGDSRR